jgi:hypothetical protein
MGCICTAWVANWGQKKASGEACGGVFRYKTAPKSVHNCRSVLPGSKQGHGHSPEPSPPAPAIEKTTAFSSSSESTTSSESSTDSDSDSSGDGRPATKRSLEYVSSGDEPEVKRAKPAAKPRPVAKPAPAKKDKEEKDEKKKKDDKKDAEEVEEVEREKPKVTQAIANSYLMNSKKTIPLSSLAWDRERKFGQCRVLKKWLATKYFNRMKAEGAPKFVYSEGQAYCKGV